MGVGGGGTRNVQRAPIYSRWLYRDVDFIYTNGSGFYHFHPLSDWDIKDHWTIEFSGDSQVDYPLVASSVPTTSSIKLSLVSISWYLYHTAEFNIPSNGMWVVNMDFGTRSFRIIRSLQGKRWRILTVFFDARSHFFDGFSTFVPKAMGQSLAAQCCYDCAFQTTSLYDAIYRFNKSVFTRFTCFHWWGCWHPIGWWPHTKCWNLSAQIIRSWVFHHFSEENPH